MKKLLILLMLGITAVGCGTTKQSDNSSTLTLSGKLEEMGMTTFQYGTHKLQSEGKTYALKSSLDLNRYINKEVTIKGSRVAGYPVENGPDFIEVSAVTEK